MKNYRKWLEERKEQIQDFLALPDEVLPRGERAGLIRELGQILNELDEMDDGAHWTQDKGDTLPKIVINELRSSQKVSRQ